MKPYTKSELIALAAQGYPDGHILQSWDFKNNALISDSGDSLALFVTREILEVTENEKSGFAQLLAMCNAMDGAVADLNEIRIELSRTMQNAISYDFFNWLQKTNKVYSESLLRSWLTVCEAETRCFNVEEMLENIKHAWGEASCSVDDFVAKLEETLKVKLPPTDEKIEIDGK